jgi:hypothetical protein
MNNDLASANKIRSSCDMLATKIEAFVKQLYPKRVISLDKCRRDSTHVIRAIAQCIEIGNGEPIEFVAARFFKGNKLQLISLHSEISAYKNLKNDILELEISNEAKENAGLLIDKFIYLLQNGIDLSYSNFSSWQNAIAAKSQTAAWGEKIPELYVINEIVDELHMCSPSKQNLIRYNLTIVKNFTDDNRKKAIYGCTETYNKSKVYNGQVLAPYLFVFSNRTYGDEFRAPNADKNCHTMIDTGIAASFVAYSAVSKGLSIGFCGCLSNTKRLKEMLGVIPTLIVGVGYADSVSRFICPILDKSVDAAQRHTSKPNISEYITYL